MNRIFFLLALAVLPLSGCGVDWFPATVSSSSSSSSNSSGTPSASIATVSPFSFASVTGVAAGSTQSSSAITVTLTSGTSAPISVTGGKYSTDNGTTFTSTAGTVKTGATVVVQQTAAAGDNQTVTTTLVIANQSATFSSTTAPTSVGAFSFNPASVTDAAVSTLETSSAQVTLTTGTSAAISITNGQYSLDNGVTFTSAAGTVKSGTTVQVQQTSAATDGVTLTTTLTVGNQSALFKSTTGTPVATAGAFSFTPITGASAGALQTSNAITVVLTGSASAPISIAGTGAKYSINGAAYTALPGTVNNGDSVTVQQTAASGDNQFLASTLNIADQSAIFSSTTAPTLVADFSFAPSVVSDLPDQVETSNPISVVLTTGTSAPISVAGGGGYSTDNGVTFVQTAGTVKNGDIVSVQTITPSVAGQSISTTLTIGTKSATFSGIASSVTAASFTSLGSVFGVNPGAQESTNPITLTLVGGSSAPIAISGGQYKIGSGSYTSASGTVNNGDTIAVRGTASTVSGQKVTITVFVGGSKGTFLISTL